MSDEPRRPKRPRDVDKLAKQIVDEATGEAEPEPEPEHPRDKNPAVVALGRLGGKARSEKLTAEERGEKRGKGLVRPQRSAETENHHPGWTVAGQDADRDVS